MTAPMAINDVVQIVIGYRVASQECRAVLHYRVETLGASVSAELQLVQIADFLAGDAGDNYPLLRKIIEGTTNTTYFDFLQAQRVKPARTIYARSEIDEVGLLTGATAPPNVCISFEKQSTHVGRKGVGRLQLAGLPSADVGARISDTWIAGHGTLIRDALYEQITITPEGGMQLRPCLPAGGADNSYDLWNAIIRDTTRTMHRRTVGLGI